MPSIIHSSRDSSTQKSNYYCQALPLPRVYPLSTRRIGPWPNSQVFSLHIYILVRVGVVTTWKWGPEHSVMKVYPKVVILFWVDCFVPFFQGKLKKDFDRERKTAETDWYDYDGLHMEFVIWAARSFLCDMFCLAWCAESGSKPFVWCTNRGK